MATRYSKAGRGKPWTVKELEALTADAKGDVLSDGGGLYGDVRVDSAGAVTIRYRNAFKRKDGGVGWNHCGTFPRDGAQDIRRNRDKARALSREGIDPNEARAAARIEAQAKVAATIARANLEARQGKTLRDLSDAWQASLNHRDGGKETRRQMDKDLLSFRATRAALPLGDRQLRTIEEADLRAVIKAIVAREAPRMAVKMHIQLGTMFRYAQKRKAWRDLVREHDPMALLEITSIMPPTYDMDNIRDRMLTNEEIVELRDRLRGAVADREQRADKRAGARPLDPATECAIWIMLATLCRVGELSKARWNNVDLVAGTWFIPAADRKATRAGRGRYIASDLQVTLSDFALRHFAALKKLTGDSACCFPGRDRNTSIERQAITKAIGDRQIRFRKSPLAGRAANDTLVLASGSNGEWTAHDLRRTGAQIMQRLRVFPDLIDLCQGHVLAGPAGKSGKTRKHYLQYDYADEKADAWRKLGERLDTLLNGSNVVAMPLRWEA